MTATKEKEITQITVPIPLEQLEEIHEVWIQFASVLEVADSHEGSADILRLLQPLESRMSEVVFEEWETLMDKAKKKGGAA